MSYKDHKLNHCNINLVQKRKKARKSDLVLEKSFSSPFFMT